MNRAIGELDEVVALYQRHADPGDVRVATSMRELAYAYDDVGEQAKAEAILIRLANRRSFEVYADDQALALQSLAVHYGRRDDLAAATSALQEALAGLSPVREQDIGELLASVLRMTWRALPSSVATSRVLSVGWRRS